MIAEVRGFAAIHRSAHRLFHRALEGLSDAQAREGQGGANPALWVAAHIVTVRAGFTRALGGDCPEPWGGQFRRGAEVGAVTEWPALADVRAKWDEVHAAYLERLELVTAEQLPQPTKLPGLDDTFLGVLALAAFHDSYHVGQLGTARRGQGLDRLVG